MVNHQRGAEIPLGSGMGARWGTPTLEVPKEKGCRWGGALRQISGKVVPLFPSGGPWLSVLLSSSLPSLKNGVQGLVSPSLSHSPVTEGWACSGSSVQPAFP